MGGGKEKGEGTVMWPRKGGDSFVGEYEGRKRLRRNDTPGELQTDRQTGISRAVTTLVTKKTLASCKCLDQRQCLVQQASACSGGTSPLSQGYLEERVHPTATFRVDFFWYPQVVQDVFPPATHVRTSPDFENTVS